MYFNTIYNEKKILEINVLASSLVINSISQDETILTNEYPIAVGLVLLSNFSSLFS